jgi:hypothetical protein
MDNALVLLRQRAKFDSGALRSKEKQSMAEIRGGTAGVPANIAEQMEADARLMSSRIGAPGGDKIRFVEKQFKVPGLDVMADRLRVVVVDFVSYNAFYDRIYSEKDRTPPACFALGVDPKAMVPSENSPEKQADACSECPYDEFGSKGKGKACGNHRVLAVVEPNDDPKAPMYIMQLPPTSIKHWDAYVAAIAAQFKKGPYAVETEIYFDPASKWESPRFGDPSPNENLLVHFARREAARARLLTEPDVSQWTPLKKVAPPKGKK